MSAVKERIQQFLAQWKRDSIHAKDVFIRYFEFLQQKDIEFDFKERPGISYSLRAKHAAQKNRDLFVLIDVIDDEPENRWLSVCFYADMVNDPDNLADFVPNGLLGEDANCFTLDSDDPSMQNYILARLNDAADKAKNA